MTRDTYRDRTRANRSGGQRAKRQNSRQPNQPNQPTRSSEEGETRLTRRAAIGGALCAILAGSGATAGVTMDGSVLGGATTKADKAVLVSDAITYSLNNGLGNVSDDGTRFRTSANINQGDGYVVDLTLDNNSNQGRTERLALDVPEPLEVEVEGDTATGVKVARDQKGRWLVKMDDSLGQVVRITVAAPDAIEPGFYEMTGELKPLDFDSGGNGGS